MRFGGACDRDMKKMASKSDEISIELDGNDETDVLEESQHFHDPWFHQHYDADSAYGNRPPFYPPHGYYPYGTGPFAPQRVCDTVYSTSFYAPTPDMRYQSEPPTHDVQVGCDDNLCYNYV